jgi:hypothetical protein
MKILFISIANKYATCIAFSSYKEIIVFVLGEFFEPSLQKQQIIPRCIYSKELVSDLVWMIAQK